MEEPSRTELLASIDEDNVLIQTLRKRTIALNMRVRELQDQVTQLQDLMGKIQKAE